MRRDWWILDGVFGEELNWRICLSVSQLDSKMQLLMTQKQRSTEDRFHLPVVIFVLYLYHPQKSRMMQCNDENEIILWIYTQ